MKKGKETIKCIHIRKLYKLCGEVPIPHSTNNGQDQETSMGTANDTNTDEEQLKDFILNKIEEDFLVKKEDLLVQKVSIDYGKSSQDPVGSVIFFDKDGNITKIRKENISAILPKIFLDWKIRVYCKHGDLDERQYHRGIQRMMQE